MCLLVAGLALFKLLFKARALINRVVELGETVGKFAAINEEFKAVGDSRVVEIFFGQRRNFRRVVCDENRLNQIVFDLRLKGRVQDSAYAETFFVGHAD